MSTIAAAPAPFAGMKRVKVPRGPSDASIFPLVLTYALTAVLISLAVRGTFSFFFGPQEAGAIADESGGPAQKVLSVLMYGTMVAVLPAVYKNLWRLLQQQPILLVLPVWGILSTLWSTSPIRTFPTGIFILILTAFGYYLAVRFTPRQQMQLFVFTGMMSTLLSYATIVLLPRAGVDHKNSTTGLEGIFPQKNICAVITILLLTVGFCYEFKGRNRRLKKIAFFVLLTLLILGTMARTGWILLAVMTGFILLLKGLHRLRTLERFTITWFLPAVCLAAGSLIYANSAFLLHLIGKGATLSGRTGVWQVVFVAIVERPLLGYGYGAFWIGSNPMAAHLRVILGDPVLNNAENGVLQLWLELGLIGVLMLLFLLFRTCRNAVICFRSNTPNYAIWYMAILFYNLLSLVDGNKFLLWSSIEWVMFVMADIGLANEARRVRALRAAPVGSHRGG